jgi:hypothetical protein
MKNTLKFLVLLAILAIPAIAFAQGSGSVEPPSSPSPSFPSTESRGSETNFAVTRTVAGSIVGLKEGILTVKNNKGKETRVALVERTKFKQGKNTLDRKELDLNLFKEGQQVKIIYLPIENKDIDKVALEIRFVEDKSEKEKPKLGE